MEIFRLFGSIFVDNKEANNSISKTEGKAEGLTKKLGEGIKKAALWGGGLAAGAGIGLAAFVKAGTGIEDALNGLQSSTGASNKEMDGMKTSLENIYKGNYGESFGDIADSMALVKQNTGLAGKALENTTKNALILRDTFDMNVNESARTAQSLMKQFSITSEQAYNLIAQGAQNGANKNGDLLDSLNEYAPQFKSLGFSAEQFTNVLIDGAKNGQFSIDKVGDAVKEFNIRAKDGSKTTVDAFKSLGMNANQMGEKFAKGGKTGADAFKQVVTALNNVKDPVEKNRIGVELMGSQFEDLQSKGISALGNIGTTASTTKNTLGEIDKVKYDSFGSALRGIGRNIMMGLFNPFEKKVMPKMNEFAGWIDAHMPQIQSRIKTTIDAAVKVFNGLGKAVKWTKDNMNWLLPVIVGITGAVVAQMIIDKLVIMYKAWQAVTKTQTTLTWLLNAAMAANPLEWVALAIGAVIAVSILLYKNWDTVKKYAINLWNRLGPLKAGLLALTGPFGLIVAAGVKVYKNWDTIMEKARTLVSKIKGFFSNLKIHIPLPHFDLKTIHKNIAGISVPIPDVNVNWYAKGTNFAPGGLAVVGEQGPELVNLPRGSKVHTASETKDILSNNNLIDAIMSLATRPLSISVDGRELAFVSYEHITEFQQRVRNTKNKFGGS